MTLAKLSLRVLLGGLFVGHGTQKLFGWFGGHGLDGTAGFFENALGLRPGKRHALGAGAGETLGGALLLTGTLTPVGTTLLTGAMTTAIRKVHAPNGPWVTESGWEYNAVIIAAAAALAEAGAGSLSVDETAFPDLNGPLVALAAVGAGVAGSYLFTEVLNEAPAAAPDDVSESDGSPAEAVGAPAA